MAWYARIICVIGLVLLAAWAPSGPAFDLSWHSIDGGGGLFSGGSLDLHGVIGQHDAGQPMTGGGFSLSGGFLAGGVQQCPADTDANGTVNVTDLLALLAAWGSCPAPCLPDVDDDGDVDVTDLLELLAMWGPCDT